MNKALKLLINQILKCSNIKVIYIMGPGAVGKSTFSEYFQHVATLKNKSCEIINLDAYLLNKTYRSNNGWLTAHNPNAYKSTLIYNDINNLVVHKKKQMIPIHNRIKTIDSYKEASPSDFLIIEGAVSFWFNINHLSTLKIFIDAEKEVQFKLRYLRENAELGYNLELSEKRFQVYWHDYLTYIKPQKENAEFVLNVGLNYVYNLETNKISS